MGTALLKRRGGTKARQTTSRGGVRTFWRNDKNRRRNRGPRKSLARVGRFVEAEERGKLDRVPGVRDGRGGGTD